MKNKLLGKYGEDIVSNYISKNGMSIVKRNYSCKSGEIDIIASQGDTIVFIEVKTRTSEKYGRPSQAVSVSKQRKLIKTALMFMTQKNLFDYSCRFDVVEVNVDKETKSYNITYIKDAFQYTGKYGY